MVKLNKEKTRIIILDVSKVQSYSSNQEYGWYRFITFGMESSRLLCNYIQSSFDISLPRVDNRVIKGKPVQWWYNPYVRLLDKSVFEMIFDKSIFLSLDHGNYNESYYGGNGGYLAWINDKIDLDEFLGED